jgi:hypothetical protein
MSQHEEGPPRIWPFGGESSGPLNLFHKHPSLSNQFGRLYEAHPDDHKQLQDLDLMVSFANITKVIKISRACSLSITFSTYGNNCKF